MLIDAHTHIDQYGEELESVLKEIQTRKIYSVSVSMDIPSYHRTKAIAGSCPYILTAFGIHPWRAPEFEGELTQLDPLIEEAPMTGEIGLDYYFEENSDHYPEQRRLFDYQLHQAASHEKIVNLHTKGAEREIVEKLEESGIRRSIVHWYSGPLDLIDRYLAAGAYFTIGVELLFSEHIRQVLEAIPTNRLLTETDNPTGYEWLAGKRGMPSILEKVVHEIARLNDMTDSEVISLASDNFESLISEAPSVKEQWFKAASQ